MFKIDMHSLLLILGINKLLLGILLHNLADKKSNKAVNYWAWGSIITAIGLTIYAFYPITQNIFIDFLYSFFLNLFIITGDIIFLFGFYIFHNKPIKKQYFILLGIVLCNTIMFSLVQHVIWIRMFINTLTVMVFYGISTIEIRRINRNTLRPFFLMISYIYVFFTFLQFTRTVLVVLFKPQYAVDSSIIAVMLMALAGIGLNVITFILIIIIYRSINIKLNEQIDSMNKLYRIIAHDLRGPLSNILNYNNILKTSIHSWSNEKTHEWITDIERMSTRTVFLMENLFQWSSSQLKEIKINKKTTDVTELIQQSIGLLKSHAQSKSIDVVFDNPNSIYAQCDADMMSIVVRNLLQNAIKYSNPDSIVVVSIEELKNDVRIKIRDNGVGISPMEIESLFEFKKNSQTSGTAHEKGSGFGLVLCKEFVDLHNGTIEVSSTVNQGTTIQVIIPK